VRIGRDPQNEVCVTHRGVSKLHAELKVLEQPHSSKDSGVKLEKHGPPERLLAIRDLSQNGTSMLLADGKRRRINKNKDCRLPKQGRVSIALPEVCKASDGERITLYITRLDVDASLLPAGFTGSADAPQLQLRPASPSKVPKVQPVLPKAAVPMSPKRASKRKAEEVEASATDPPPKPVKAVKREAKQEEGAIEAKAKKQHKEPKHSRMASPSPRRPAVGDKSQLPKGSLSVAQVGALARSGLPQASASSSATARGLAVVVPPPPQASAGKAGKVDNRSDDASSQWMAGMARTQQYGAAAGAMAPWSWPGRAPMWPSWAGNVGQLTPEQQMRQKIYMMYQVYNPAKLVDFNKIMSKYKGSEKKLYAALWVKYAEPAGAGPMPPDAESPRRGKESPPDDEYRSHRGRGKAVWQR